MRTARRVLLLVTLIVLAALGTRSQRIAGEIQADSRQMRCVIKVTADGDVVPLSLDLVESLLRSDGVAGKAAQRVFPGRSVAEEFLDIRPLGGERTERLEAPGESPDANAPNEAKKQRPSETRTTLFALWVRVPDAVKPAAREFGSALIENLRNTLQEVFAARVEELNRQLKEAEVRQEAARKEFENVVRPSVQTNVEGIRLDPADEAVHAQLEKTVNLAAWDPQTAAGHAFEILRNSVQPPLNIIVVWRDLIENVLVDPSTAINIDGLPSVRLGAALESLLSALSDPGYPDNPVTYVINEGVITVATRSSLPRKMETRVYNLPPLIRAAWQTLEVIAIIQETIEPESWLELDASMPHAKGTIAPSGDVRLIVSQTRDVQVKIQRLLRTMSQSLTVPLPVDTPPEALSEQMQVLISYRDTLDKELDRLQENQDAIARERTDAERQGMQQSLLNATTDLSRVVMDLEAIRDKMTGAHADEVERTIGKIKECIGHCSQGVRLTTPPFSDLISPPRWWQEEQDRTLKERIIAQRRSLEEVSRRIAEMQRTLAGPRTFDPAVSRIQWAARRLEQAEARVYDLKDRIARLQPCSVTIIGGTE